MFGSMLAQPLTPKQRRLVETLVADGRLIKEAVKVADYSQNGRGEAGWIAGRPSG